MRSCCHHPLAPEDRTLPNGPCPAAAVDAMKGLHVGRRWPRHGHLDARGIASATDVIDKVRANEDTLTYILTKHASEPHTYVWIERFRDEDALAVHRAAPYMAVALQNLPEWLAKPPHFFRLEQIASAH